MRTAITVLALALVSFACKPDLEGVSSCINEIVHDADTRKSDYFASQIIEYEYENDKYYLIVSQCCDMLNILLDSECNEICSPSGGFLGVGDGTCEEWAYALSEGVIIWERE